MPVELPALFRCGLCVTGQINFLINCFETFIRTSVRHGLTDSIVALAVDSGTLNARIYQSPSHSYLHILS